TNALARFADQRGDGDVDHHRVALMLQPLLVDAGDLLGIAAAGNFLDEFDWQKAGERLANRVVARNLEELFHAAVPGFNRSVEIDGQNANVERFHDVFSEVFQARDFEGLLFEGGVQLRIVERNGQVSGDGLHQFDIVAGKEIAVHRFAEAEESDGALSNAAGDEVIEIELFDRAADRIRNIGNAAGG